MSAAPEDYLDTAFDWVMREVRVDNVAARSMRELIRSRHTEGTAKLAKHIVKIWPPDGQWKAGLDFLQQEIHDALEDEGDWAPGDEPVGVPVKDLVTLLVGRIFAVQYRLFRAHQVREMLATDFGRRIYHSIEMNRHEDDAYQHCGRDKGHLLPIEVGLAMMTEPACAHPACRCTFDLSKTRLLTTES